MSDKKYNIKIGSDTSGLLLVLFIGLKLTGYINWSWWWVMAPLWIPLALAGVVFGIVFIIYACSEWGKR